MCLVKCLSNGITDGLLVLQLRHFFKVGESRSQGRAMLMSIAYQMAERLPGMAQVNGSRSGRIWGLNQANRDICPPVCVLPALSCSTMSWRSLAPTLGPCHCLMSLPGDEWI